MNAADQAGPALDLRVATEVMQLTACDKWEPMNFGSAGGPAVVKRCDHEKDTCFPTLERGSVFGRVGGCPRFSTDRATALAVVDRLADAYGWDTGINVSATQPPDQRYEVMVFRPLPDMVYTTREVSSSLPLAVCLAALAAVEARPS